MMTKIMLLQKILCMFRQWKILSAMCFIW